jgi:hypothetical protein
MRVLSLGGGQQSTAIYLLAAQGDIPAIDYAVFADTGEEPSWVYETVEELSRFPGGPPILKRARTDEANQPIRLGDNLITGQGGRFASIPAFLRHRNWFSRNGKNAKGKLPRQCTREFKTDVVDQCIRRELLGLDKGQAYKGPRVTQIIGFDFNEGMRIVKTKDRLAKTSFSVGEFPLWDMQWKRSDCIAYVKEILGHDIGSSACTFCPLVGNAFRRSVRERDPKGWNRACMIDTALRYSKTRAAQGLESDIYVSDRLVPLGKLNIDEPDGVIDFAQDCEGFCGH